MIALCCESFHYRQILCPRANLLLVALRHYTTDLQNVRQIVRGPRRHKLSNGYRAQRRVPPAQFQLRRRQVRRPQAVDTVIAGISEFVQQGGERFLVSVAELRLAIEGIKGPLVAVLQDNEQARDPIGSLCVDQMANYDVRAPRTGSLVG